MTYHGENALKQITSSNGVIERSLNGHHWLHKWKQEGRCMHCGKSFQQKIFHDKANLYLLEIQINLPVYTDYQVVTLIIMFRKQSAA